MNSLPQPQHGGPAAVSERRRQAAVRAPRKTDTVLRDAGWRPELHRVLIERRRMAGVIHGAGLAPG
jgi:hypothetical protein